MRRDPQIAIQPELYDSLKKEAKKNKRTIKGQAELMIEQQLKNNGGEQNEKP